MKISEQIRARLTNKGIPFAANDNIYEVFDPGELALLQVELEEKLQEVLQTLVIDTENDHNTQGTAERVARMYLTEVFRGRYEPAPNVTDFPNAKHLDEIYTVGPIAVRSACSHHLVPIIGHCWIGVIPSLRVIGLSKFNRLTDWVMARPQIQEEACVMLADEIERMINPMALAVVIKAQHQCMTWRGVKDNETQMVTSVMRGRFRSNPAARAELMHLLAGQGYK